MSGVVRLAVAQSPAELEGVKARLYWLAEILTDVTAHGADLVLLPELFTCGYNIGNRVVECSEASDGATAKAIMHLAQKNRVAIHYGYAERDGMKIYNAAQCFSKDCARLAGHRKLAIPPGFEGEQFSKGEGCELFTLNGVTIATLICYDAEFPETARHVAMMGADLILVPTALAAQWQWVSKTMIPTRAYENGVYLAYANHAGAEAGIEYLGQSFIAKPDGHELIRAGSKPEIIYGDVRRIMVKAAQSRLPYLTDRSHLIL